MSWFLVNGRTNPSDFLMTAPYIYLMSTFRVRPVNKSTLPRHSEKAVFDANGVLFCCCVIVCMTYKWKQSYQTVPPMLTCRFSPNQLRFGYRFALDVTGMNGDHLSWTRLQHAPVPPGKKFAKKNSNQMWRKSTKAVTKPSLEVSSLGLNFIARQERQYWTILTNSNTDIFKNLAFYNICILKWCYWSMHSV